MEMNVEKVPRDRLLFKEFITSLIALSVLSWAALIFPAPLSAPGGELTPSGVAVKAPWIFVGLQVLLQYIHPLWGGVVLPLTGRRATGLAAVGSTVAVLPPVFHRGFYASPAIGHGPYIIWFFEMRRP